MKSKLICETRIKTEGRLKGQRAAVIIWEIGNGSVTIDGQQHITGNGVKFQWKVGVLASSLDETIAFLQKIRKEIKKKRGE